MNNQNIDGFDSTAASVLEFLRVECGLNTTGIEMDTALFSSRALSSLDILKLVAFLETTHSISIDAWEVSLESLDSLERIVFLVEEKQKKD